MYFQIIILALSIILMIWTTAFKKINAFFALLIVSIIFGTVCGIDQSQIMGIVKTGFGKTMEKIGILIIMGTMLGVILEKTGATISMANAIIKFVKERNAPVAIALTGFIVGLPIFCDSAFIILSGLNNSLIKRSGKGKLMMTSVLALSLLSVHCLVPPHPGITAATITLGTDMGLVMLWGMVLSIPVILVGFVWTTFMNSKSSIEEIDIHDADEPTMHIPSSFKSFIPVIIPIFLIAFRSVILLPEIKTSIHPLMLKISEIIGEPVYALSIGIIIAFLLFQKDLFSNFNNWASDTLVKAAAILFVTAGGGIFGEMIQQTGVGMNIGRWMSSHSTGIFLPFVLAAILKSAQGSSTVAIITTASIIAPILDAMGIHSSTEMLLYILSMGAGSMVFSHTNDSYFWVICKFSNIEPNAALRVYSSGTAIMGIFAQWIIWVVYLLGGF